MKVACNYSGWFPVDRGVFLTPVWQDEQAFRVYASLLASATHRDMIETVGSVSVSLQPGQLTASQSEICALTGYDRNTVRNALGVLKREGAVECGVPQNRRFSVVTVHGFPFSQQGEGKNGEAGFSLDSLPIESTKIYPPFDGGNVVDDAGFDVADGLDDTNHFPENPPALYRNKEYKELNNIKKEKNILFSSSSITFILSLWRKAREQAGELYCEDPVTLEGAALMAELWFDTGKATEADIAAAMTNFVQTVKTNEAAKFYTLKTLANSFGTYAVQPADASPAVGRVKMAVWTIRCDVCKSATTRLAKEGQTLGPRPCSFEFPGGGCGGVIQPAFDCWIGG